MKGAFIVFEGLDGSGKGTMLTKTADYLFNEYKAFDRIVLTREPTYSGTGKQIRKMLQQSDSPMSDAKRLLQLYLDDRKTHLEFLRPLINQNCVILCDRYKYSTLAYQQTQGIPLDSIVKLHEKMLVTDIVFFLDVSPAVALQRIKESRSSIEKFEKEFFFEELRANYLKLPSVLPNENIKIIDANRSKDEVFDLIKSHLDIFFKAKMAEQ